jgi:small subunit ribosomal protein S21
VLVYKAFDFLQKNLPRKVVIVLAVTRIRDSESFESAFRRFKKSCEKAGILSEVKKREHFEKKSVRDKKKSAAARKRAVKKLKRGYGE